MAMSRELIRGGCMAAAFFMAAVLFLAADKAGQVPLLPDLNDKVVHFCYFGVMALLLAHGVGRTWWGIPMLVVPLVGAFDEWHQLYVPGRDGSVWDWVADAVGTSVALYLYVRGTASRVRTEGKNMTED
jgi:VanZ family protein